MAGVNPDELRETIAYLKDRCGPSDMPARFGRHLAIIGAYLAEQAESRLPKTKTVECWHVEYAAKLQGRWSPMVTTTDSEEEARRLAHELTVKGLTACISITGPHQQLVPA